MLHIWTFSTDDNKLVDLVRSATMHGIELNVVKSNVWNGFEDKIKGMLSVVDNYADDDIVCFIDAYDVLINSPPSEIIRLFREFNSDFVLSAELNCFPEKFRNLYSQSQWTNFHYVNSGGYIGYKHAVKDFLTWKSLPDIVEICKDGGDQAYLTTYYLENKGSKSIVLDSDCKLFLSMFGVDWSEISIYRGNIYNEILKNQPCFIHFNGGSWKLEVGGASVIPGVIFKLALSQTSRTPLTLAEWKQTNALPWPRIPQV